MTNAGQPAVPTVDQIEQWLSRPRFARYLVAAGQDPGRAVQLYEWNSHLATAAFRDVGHFEVALRNVYDAELSQTHPGWAIDPHSNLFTLESGPAKDRLAQRDLNERSRQRLADIARVIGKNATHGQTVAELDFGFWVQLTRKERISTVWTPHLSKVVPRHVSRGQLHLLVDNVRKFRNRLAHNEPVFSSRTGLSARMDDLYTVFDWIRPDVASWLKYRSDVSRLIQMCPVPGLVVS